MTAHLLTLSIGPVQEFISAARRTRDLWFGSLLLSEVSKAAAARVAELNGTLIFPADLPSREESGIANIILAEVPSGIDPAAVAVQARAAAQARWEQRAAEARARFHSVIRDDVWNDQLKGVIECYAAWMPFTPETYQEQRRRLSRLLAGRKSCRDFQAGRPWPGVPKSSLDGLRETVLCDGTRDGQRGLRVRAGEQLDIVGLVKRTGGGRKAYPSVSRVAADPWLRGASESDLAGLGEACDALGDVVHRIDTTRLSNPYARFPYEGTVVYRTRHRELVEEAGSESVDLQKLEAALACVENSAARAGRGREPEPYLAVLVADGDRMGELLSQCTTPDQHRDLSRRLAGFATGAEDIVREHHGVLIYAGGDDVLAFLPLDTALRCARRLYEDFGERMKPATLSVGVAIGHFYEDLEDLLQYGRAAEKDAKQPDRDGLAVHLHKRGGAPIEVRGRWGDGLDGRLEQFANSFLSRAVSGRTPYELHRLADNYDGWPPETVAEALQRDACRLIEKKRPSGTEDHMRQIRERIEQRVKNPESLRLLARELLIARQIAPALRQSGQGRAS